jgi:NAD(P)-dependent dehydrogenase (short-subunit alcohol dehydrogenase family)
MSNVSFDFAGKVVLVTGGGSGIGRASAQAFAASGAAVIVADVSEGNGTETVHAIRTAGGSAEFRPVDVADEVGVARLIAGIVGTHGRLDIAHNNAGIEAPVARQNIRVNAVCPGLVDTPFVGYLPRPAVERLMLTTPLHRIGTPEEMAQAVLWLCSDSASYVVGHSLSVDGGVALGGTGIYFDDLGVFA